MQIDWSKAVAVEKVDGSLIKIYNHKGHWYVSTKGTAYADSDCMGYGITFFELVLVALGCKNDSEFQKKCEYANLYKGFTYIFELTSIENRVVKRYDGYKLHYLAARDNSDGEYVTTIGNGPAMELGAHKIKEYRFSSTEECMMVARHLKNLDEGFVIFQDGVPVAKIKSPAYVAVHHIRDSLNMGRDNALIPVVVTGECDEVISYFPEYESRIREIEVVWNGIVEKAKQAYSEICKIENQKEFAQMVMSKVPKLSAIMFSARKLDKTTHDVIMSLETNRKVRLVEDHL